jgi:hypothetical protein
LCYVTLLRAKQKLFEAGKINAQSLTGVAYCAFFEAVKTCDVEAEKEFDTEEALLSECQNVAFGPTIADKSVEAWCPEEDSNLHTLRHTDLNRARLPIPPSGHKIA